MNNIIICVFIIIVILCLIQFIISSENACEQFELNTNERIVDMKKIKYYFLTLPNIKRKEHMQEIFKSYDLKEINPHTGISRNKSGATGFGKMIDQGLKDQDYTKPFQPFIILEDDCSLYREIPNYLTIPYDADLLYIGLSNAAYGKDNHVYGKSINDKHFRIYNMLATHGIMICSAIGASVILKCMMESFYNDSPWDIHLREIQPHYKVYGLKEPLVYQDKQFGGQEHPTKVSYKKSWDHEYPSEYINHTNISAIMKNNK